MRPKLYRAWEMEFSKFPFPPSPPHPRCEGFHGEAHGGTALSTVHGEQRSTSSSSFSQDKGGSRPPPYQTNSSALVFPDR